MKPVLGARDDGSLSFLDLIELVVVNKFRTGSNRSMPLERLRAAHTFAREQLHLEFPFASGRLWAEGGHILHDFEEANPGPGRLAIDVNGIYVLPIEIEEAEPNFVFDEVQNLVAAWYPVGRQVPLVLDPERGGGWPVIEGSNVRGETLLVRWKAGWSIQALADDFQLEPMTVEEVLRAAA